MKVHSCKDESANHFAYLSYPLHPHRHLRVNRDALSLFLRSSFTPSFSLTSPFFDSTRSLPSRPPSSFPLFQSKSSSLFLYYALHTHPHKFPALGRCDQTLYSHTSIGCHDDGG